MAAAALVSTGNWTRETLEESLDLAWRVDISREDLDEQGASLSQACADLKAAWDLLSWMRERYDDRALRVSLGDRVAPEPESVTVEKWIARATKFGRDVTPRFFDNRDESLLARLPALIRTHCAGTARNYLAMGSGFYEAGGSGDEIPLVLSQIVERLVADGRSGSGTVGGVGGRRQPVSPRPRERIPVDGSTAASGPTALARRRAGPTRVGAGDRRVRSRRGDNSAALGIGRSMDPPRELPDAAGRRGDSDGR